tara:strand:+ start:384 stop:650 length:267 start_codon:yes stop_codon:yes gene_type:complete
MTTLLKTIRATYDQSGDGKNVGPTADNTSRIALIKKLQIRTNLNDGTKKFAQLWGLNNLNNDNGNQIGSTGDSGVRTKFVGIFPRMHF